MTTRDGSPPSSDEREDFKCPVCWAIACEPLCLKPCGHFMCKSCYQSLRNSASANTCPMCRANIARTLPHKGMEKKMAQLQEKCPGCQEFVALSTMKKHVVVCPTLLNLERCSDQSNNRQCPPWKSKQRQESYDNLRKNDVQRRRVRHNYNDENCDEFSRLDNEHLRPFRNQRPSFRFEDKGSQHPPFKGRGRGGCIEVPKQRPNSCNMEQELYEDENFDEFSRQDNQHLRPFRNQRPSFRFEDKGSQHPPFKGRGRGGCIEVPKQERDSYDVEQKLYDDERSDDFSQQDKQHLRPFKPQRSTFNGIEPNGADHPNFNGGGKGTWNTNVGNGPQIFAQSHWNQRNRKEMQPRTVEPSRAKNSAYQAESAGEASHMLGTAYLDPSKGARPKYQQNIQRSNPMQDRSRIPSTTTTVSGKSSACDNTASAASSSQSSDNSRYMCPYCGEVGLPQVDLVNHCLGQHASDKRRVVCPICVSMPWGNPNQLSSNFIEHLRMRHAFDYCDYVLEGDGDDEEAMLARALEASLQDIWEKS